MALELDFGRVRSMVGRLGLGRAIAVETLAGGSSPVFRIDLADGSALVLKSYDRPEKLPRREAYAAGLVAPLGLPTTRYLAIDETLADLPFAFALANYLEGVPVATFRDAPDAGDLYCQMGQLLRRLHGIRLPAFGHFEAGGIASPVIGNADYMRKVAGHAFGQFRHYGGKPALAGALEGAVAARAELFGHSRGPVFAHDDLHPNNVLARRDAEGRLHLSGLLDFGNARSADAVFDLAKTLFICEHDAPGSREAILAGYGPVDHPDPAGALWLYTLLHRVVMWWWLRHVGQIGEDERHELIVALEAMADEARPF